MPTISLRLSERKILLIVIDLILVNLTTLLALCIHAVRNFVPFNGEFIWKNIFWFVSLSGLWLLSSLLNDFYGTQKLTELIKSMPSLLGTVFLVQIIYLGIFFFSAPLNILPRGIVLYQGASSFILIGAWRVLYISIAKNPSFGRRILIIGAGEAGKTIAQIIHQYARHEYKIVGFIDDDENKRDSSVYIEIDEISNGQGEKIDSGFGTSIQFPVHGSSTDMRHLLQAWRVSEIILAVTQDISAALFQALLESKEQGVQITLMPVLFEKLTGRVPIDYISGDNWYVALPLDSAESGGFYPVATRLFDIIASLIGLAILLPIFPILVLVLYLDSPGAIFYTQERLGKGGKPFYLYKLRTMVPEAEKNGAERARTDDPRITRFGKILRKVRLDEMPQLINVLKGDMSSVGPRPERPEHLKELDYLIPFHRLRNSVKPGMAGWAVVNYGYIENLEDAKIRLQYDLYYVKHQSMWLDLVILMRTFGQMISLKGR